MRCKNCKNKFEPRYFLQKFCMDSDECIKAFANWSKVETVKRVNKESPKRSKENKSYLVLRELFLKDKICPITGEPATEIHHKKGRIGELLCDVKYWLAVSRTGHIKIENNPEWAKQQGYSLSRLA